MSARILPPEAIDNGKPRRFRDAWRSPRGLPLAEVWIDETPRIRVVRAVFSLAPAPAGREDDEALSLRVGTARASDKQPWPAVCFSGDGLHCCDLTRGELAEVQAAIGHLFDVWHGVFP